MAHRESLLPATTAGRQRALIGIAILLTTSLSTTAATNAFDRTWCEVDAGDVRLVTDHPRDQAEDIMRRLRIFGAVAEQYLPGTSNSDNPPLRMMVFSRARDYQRAMGGTLMAGFMQPSLTENLVVVGRLPGQFSENESLFHEYMHYLLRTRANINIPVWFDEGLANTMSVAKVTSTEVQIASLPARALERSILKSRLSLEEVLEAEDVWEWPVDRRVGFYAWSWALVHWLLLGQEAGRPDLRDGLTDFIAERAPSLTQALGIPAAALDRRLHRYLGEDPDPVVHEAAAVPAELSSYRCLDQSETVRQLSLAIVQHNPELAADELRRQLDVEPDNAALWTALSLAYEAGDNREASLATARHAVVLAPADTSAAVRLAGALALGCILEISEQCRARWQEAVPLLRRSLRRDPTRQDAIFTLGLAYLYSGRPGDALNYLRIAHRRQPWAPHLNFYLGEAYRLIGDVRARRYLTRARQWSPTELWRRLAEAGLEMLEAEP